MHKALEGVKPLLPFAGPSECSSALCPAPQPRSLPLHLSPSPQQGFIAHCAAPIKLLPVPRARCAWLLESRRWQVLGTEDEAPTTKAGGSMAAGAQALAALGGSRTPRPALGWAGMGGPAKPRPWKMFGFQTALGPSPGHRLGRWWREGDSPFPRPRAKRHLFQHRGPGEAEGTPRGGRRRRAASSPGGLACSSELLGWPQTPGPACPQPVRGRGPRARRSTRVPTDSVLRNRIFHTLCSCDCVFAAPRGVGSREAP